jgi:hypothetical protein
MLFIYKLILIANVVSYVSINGDPHSSFIIFKYIIFTLPPLINIMLFIFPENFIFISLSSKYPSSFTSAKWNDESNEDDNNDDDNKEEEVEEEEENIDNDGKEEDEKEYSEEGNVLESPYIRIPFVI